MDPAHRVHYRLSRSRLLRVLPLEVLTRVRPRGDRTMNPIGVSFGPRVGDGIPLGRMNNGLFFLRVCVPWLWAWPPLGVVWWLVGSPFQK